MPATQFCPTCASEIPSDSPAELCVRCLLELGLGSEGPAGDRNLPETQRSVEAIIETDGTVTLLEPVRLPAPRRALVTILDQRPSPASALPLAQTTASNAPWLAFYEVLHPLGEGGMGRTFKVRNRTTRQVLCLKELKPNVDRRILIQECRALARASHPGLVRLLNFELDAEPPYFVMEYVEGITLARHLRQHGALPEPLVLHVAEQLFETVAYAHSQLLIHRDLKPTNIMLKQPLEAGLVPVILDLGLAIVDMRDHCDALTAIGTVAGTTAYMAPEQLDGRQLTSACDVYALGQILWEMLAGRRAFPDSLVPAITRKLRLPEGLELPEGLKRSRELEHLIHTCTRAEPAQRPTAEQALAEVRRLARLRDPESPARPPWWQFWR